MLQFNFESNIFRIIEASGLNRSSFNDLIGLRETYKGSYSELKPIQRELFENEFNVSWDAIVTGDFCPLTCGFYFKNKKSEKIPFDLVKNATSSMVSIRHLYDIMPLENARNFLRKNQIPLNIVLNSSMPINYKAVLNGLDFLTFDQSKDLGRRNGKFMIPENKLVSNPLEEICEFIEKHQSKIDMNREYETKLTKKFLEVKIKTRDFYIEAAKGKLSLIYKGILTAEGFIEGVLADRGSLFNIKTDLNGGDAGTALLQVRIE